MSNHQFKAEVSELLHLVVHSLYSHQEIFLRELISNASDALDKLKYLCLSADKFKDLNFQAQIDIKLSEDASTIEIIDSGIGMSSDELEENLGTIASSGTRQFLSQLSGEQRKDANLIGQFGVGFYSAFMVADEVTVISRRAGEEQGWQWRSDGKGEFQLEAVECLNWGTCVRLQLNENGREFANRWRLESLIKKFSNHIAFPIFLHHFESEGEDDNKKSVAKSEQVNSAAALWKRPRREITEEEYQEFYHGLQHNDQKPMLTVHVQAEGQLEYSALLYIPEKAAFDLFQQDYRCACKLYVRRVLISDDNKDLLPTYLRFMVGVIDSEDLPLNISREILQKNRVLVTIREALVKRILSELQKLSEQDKDCYHQFIEQYNRLLKEGVYSDHQHRETLQALLRFKSTMVDGWTSLADYKERMKTDQKSIYYISGATEERLRVSPLLEAYKKQGLEVLLLTDDIDEFVAPNIGPYQNLELKAINHSDSDSELQVENQDGDDFSALLGQLKELLTGQVKDVVISKRLTESPACVVNDSQDPSLQMQQIMEAMGRKEKMDVLPILEINPNHTLIKLLQNSSDDALRTDGAALLLEQALLLEGAALKDPIATAKRMVTLLEKALSADGLA